MESMLSSSSLYLTLARAQYLIGFDKLLVGRLPKLLISAMEPRLAMLNQRKVTVHHWAKDLSCLLLLFTHRQWTYRNCTVHYKPSEGKSVAEHTLVNDQVQSLLQLPSVSLPQQHQHSLTKEDRAALLGGTTAAKQFWIAEIQSALAEAAQLCRLKNVEYKRGTIRKHKLSQTWRYHSCIIAII